MAKRWLEYRAHSRRALLCYQKAFPKNTKFMVSPVEDRLGIMEFPESFVDGAIREVNVLLYKL
ncbi:hypothetical protein [Halobacillus seohaensis]|uniref:Uncharacterized protein n=1 Tax=Halobacillus seohaensis TaxID=447421 RepID=A0ABW2ENQ6_9BACI